MVKKMSKDLFDKDLHEMDIRRTQLQNRQDEVLFQYHSNLLLLIDAVRNKDDSEFDLRKTVNDNLCKCISMNRSIVDMSFEIAKEQLTQAFEKSGLVIKEKSNE
jgi:hypothetical protein|tara:strand:+ start:3525 stop:3836 length:312 start_codon:yes stop_codon:yes gene_type:complete